MAVNTTNLGIVSAYGYAKSKGYTGTEAEYAQLLADYASIAALTQNLPDIVAEEYDPQRQAQYTVGELCLHDGKLYVCNSPTSGVWDSSDWDEISIADLLATCVTCTDENSDGNIVMAIGVN